MEFSGRIYDDKNNLKKTTLQVNSSHLLRIFKSTVNYYPSIPADYDVPFQIESPFQMLYHYWDELHLLLEKDDYTDEAKMHLKLLVGFMQAELGPSREQVSTMPKAGSISFSNAWAIFRPGCLVYCEIDSHPWLLRLEKTAYEENRRDGKYLEVHCTYTDYDGQSHGEASHICRIYQKRHFSAENPCKTRKLPIFPFDWLEG